MQIDKNKIAFNSTAWANRQIRDDKLWPEGSVCLVISTFLLSQFKGEQERYANPIKYSEGSQVSRDRGFSLRPFTILKLKSTQM